MCSSFRTCPCPSGRPSTRLGVLKPPWSSNAGQAVQASTSAGNQEHWTISGHFLWRSAVQLEAGPRGGAESAHHRPQDGRPLAAQELTHLQGSGAPPHRSAGSPRAAWSPSRLQLDHRQLLLRLDGVVAVLEKKQSGLSGKIL